MSWIFHCCVTVESDPQARYAACPVCGSLHKRSVVRAAETRLVNVIVKRAVKIALANALVNL